MLIPPIGAKLGCNLAKYAEKKGLLYANIPLKDGSSLHVLDNYNLTLDNPYLQSATSFIHVKENKVLGGKGFLGSLAGQNDFIVAIAEKFKDLTTKNKPLYEQMWDQFFDHIIMK